MQHALPGCMTASNDPVRVRASIKKELSYDEIRDRRHVIISIGKYNTESFERTVKYLVKRHISFNRSPLVARGSGAERLRHWTLESLSRLEGELSLRQAAGWTRECHGD